MNSKYLLLLATCVLAANAQAHTLTAEDYARAEKYIVECDTDWAESVVTGDMSRRKVYFADDFVGTGTTGKRYDKTDVISEAGPSDVYISNTIDNIEVKFYGDTAIAYGSETWVKKDGSTGRWVWTDIWVYRDGKWQIVAAQDVDAPAEGKK